MYGLPDDFDATIFVGCTLELISFTANTIHFAFDKQTSITVSGSYALKRGVHHGIERGTAPASSSQLMVLIEKQILSGQADKEGTLTLHFTDGFQLEIFDDSKDFESYSMTVGESTTYV